MRKEYFQKIYNVDTWLGIHIKQLSYSRNLLITLAVAAFGYTMNYYQKVKESRYWLIIVGFMFFFSIVCGLCIAFLEAEKYNHYRRISRIIEQTKIDPLEDLNEDIFKEESDECDKLDKKNADFSIGQVIAFLLAAVILSFIVFTS
jgi:hypothetical protein